MEEPRRIAIHRSLNRPHLLMGAERSLVLMVGVITALLIFSGNISPWSLGLAVLFWSCSFWALVRMGKADPEMSRIYQRHVRYRSYYAARACLQAVPPATAPKNG
ncbi:conjugal transfer protein TrbD [Chitinimonas arctica]|uniref:Conjugal transfer protein TrbD n=1 Tax=Chitinimonas arctica TaxID=2594795 RepID=A0A516SHE5_9NEIS|nr:conjugal transfer protein TrbD [Chitinimonas arctica]QDQ27579.1 conjugal transfer protein TrbD [Chitinimonas arctica]